MSTNINITVGDNALLDRAKQQQAANRQAQLNRENSTRLEAQATDERTKAQAASGKDANGNPLYGVLTTTPSIDRRPAANRRQTFEYGQGYFTITRGVNDVAIIAVRSGDKTVSTTVQLTGSERPEGFRDKSGADQLPYVTPTPGTVTSQLPYYVTSSVASDIVYDSFGTILEYTRTRYLFTHASVGRLFGSGQPFTQNVTLANSGGWAQFSSEKSTNLVILPISSNLAIFAYTELRQSFKAYHIRTETVVERLIGSSIENFLSADSSFTIEEVETRTNESKIAFLVGENSVKQINYPGALLSANTTSQRYNAYAVSSEIIGGITPQTFATSTPYEVDFSGIRFFDATQLPPANLNYTQGLMAQWGEDGSSISPGIYEALKFGITPVAPVATYASIKAKLPPQGQNFKWFRVYTANNITELQRYTGQLPVSYSDPFTESAYKRVRRITYEQHPTEEYRRWTDWEVPAYCRSQALALGFTTADLTP